MTNNSMAAEAPPKVADFDPWGDGVQDEISEASALISGVLLNLKQDIGCPDSFIEAFITDVLLSDSAGWRGVTTSAGVG